MTDTYDVAWHISSKSADSGCQCVEAGPINDGSGRVAVRHSRDREGTMIIYSRAEWTAFLEGVRNGEFDFQSC